MKKNISIQGCLISLILTVSVFTCYLSSYGAIYYSIFGLIFAISCLLLFKNRNKLNGIIFFWLLTLLPVLLDNYQLSMKQYGYVLKYIPIILLLTVCNEISITHTNKIFKIYSVVGIVFAVATITFKIVPILYFIITPRLIPRLEETFGLNVNAGLTYHYSYNNIVMAIALIALLSELLGYYHYKKEISKKHLVAIVIILFGMGLTGKRAISFFVVIAFLITLYFYMSNRKNGRIFKILGTIIVVSIFGLILYSCFPSLFGLNRMFDSEGELNTAGRDKIYSLAFDLFNKNKWFGVGWGHFREYSNSLGIGVNNIDVHNVYLNLLCEVGIIGFTVFLIAFAATYIFTVKQYIYYRKNSDVLSFYGLRNMSFSLFIQTFFLLYCWTGNPLYDVPVLYPYILSVAVALMYSRKNKREWLKIND